MRRSQTSHHYGWLGDRDDAQIRRVSRRFVEALQIHEDEIISGMSEMRVCIQYTPHDQSFAACL